MLTTLLTPGHPDDHDGGTVILNDGRLIHFAPAMGAVLLVELARRPGIYELHHTSVEDDLVARFQDAIESPARTRRMTKAERTRWLEAIKTLTTTL